MSDEILVSAEHVSKKFCRSLKRSLWYGVKDVGSALSPFSRHAATEATVSDVPELRQDEFFAVRNVSFELRRGECIGLIGHNGAGKSTLLKILNGLIPPDGGRITIRGRVAALIELNAGFNPILTGRENIYTEAALLGFSRQETDAKFDAIVDFAEIGDFLDMAVQNYSSGMKVRLGFAVAAQMEPDVLLIDEVLAVGDVAFRFKCLNKIGELMKSAAVIFVSHTMPQIFRLCDEVIVLDHGNASYQGRNIADGVSRYLALFKQSEATVSGSGEVAVVAAGVDSGSTTVGLGETISIEFGAPLRFSVTLKPESITRGARVQFLLWNSEMLPVLDVMSDDLAGFPVEFMDGTPVQVSAYIRHTELNAGKYTLSVIVSSPDYDRFFCRYDNAAYIQVTAQSTSGAHFLAVAEWKAVPAQRVVPALDRGAREFSQRGI